MTFILRRYSFKYLVACFVLWAVLACLGSWPVTVYSQAAAGCSVPDLDATANYDVGAGHRSIVTADFNFDGKLDLATADRGANTVSVLMATENGAFSAALKLIVMQQPQALTAGDFNGDGKPDLAVVGGNPLMNQVMILPGNGTGGFGSGSHLTVSAGAIAVVAGHFNSDDNMDLAIACATTQTVDVLLGTQSGGFSPVRSFGVGPNPISIAVGDFNNDGNSDLVTANFNNATVSILIGTGTGSFDVARHVSIGAVRPASVATGDFNGDNKADLVVAFNESVPYGLSILLGDGAGGFGPPVIKPLNSSPTAVSVGDVNDDGKPDIVATIGGCCTSPTLEIAVLLGDGAGGFTVYKYFPAGDRPQALVLADFNGDGKTDVATANSADVSVLLGDGVGNFGTTQYPLGAGMFGAFPLVGTPGDFNGDNKLDIVMVGHERIALVLGDGFGGFGLPADFQSSYNGGYGLSSVVAADFNNDGKLDLVATDDSNGSKTLDVVSVLLGDGLGGFSTPGIFAVGRRPQQVVVGDLNNDGKADLAVANYLGDIGVLLGDGAGGFAPRTSINPTTGDGTNSIAIGDYNIDGKLDLAVVGFNLASVSILLGTGTGTFGTPTTYAVGGIGGNFISSGDFNSDGHTDLVVAVNNRSLISVLMGNGSGGFGPPSNIILNPGPIAVSVADYNSDTFSDLAILTSNVFTSAKYVLILPGDGAGNFGAPTKFIPGFNAQSLVAGDFDRNGKIDLATPSADVLSVLLNRCGRDSAVFPNLSVNDVALTETDAGTINAVFTVNLSAISDRTVRVGYYTHGVNARGGSDYRTTIGRLIFPPGVTSQTVTVPIFGDTLNEFDENFNLFLTDAINSTVSDGQGVGTIINNDPDPIPPIAVSINDITANEGHSGTSSLSFVVSLSTISGKPVTVRYETAGDTATAGTDFTTVSGILTVPDGETSATINVPVTGDNIFEFDESFVINLSSLTDAVIDDGQGRGIIRNDDPRPGITINDVFVTETNVGERGVIFTATLSNPSSQSITVDYATAAETAQAGSDYNNTSGTLTFIPGATSATLTVVTNGDIIDEDNETFLLTLFAPNNATIVKTQGRGTITDNDPPPGLVIANASVVEGDSGKVRIEFALALSSTSGKTVTVGYATGDGTATATSDYVAASGTISFAPGDISKTLAVEVNGDLTIESDEIIFVNLSNPTNANLLSNQASGTILNDDADLALLTESNSERAIALDSVLFLRDPFSLINPLNFNSDPHTRIMLFAIGLKLMEGEDASSVTAQAEDAQGRVFILPVEFVGKLPGFNQFTQLVIKLPDELANLGDVRVSIGLHGMTSTKATISIKPS